MLNLNFEIMLNVCVVLLVFLSTVVNSLQEGQVRLIGGKNEYDGTVVIYHNKKWGSICDDEWDMRDARVTCQQLGFPGAKRSAKRSEFGRGRRRMWMSRVRCSGFESQLHYCMFFGWGRIRHRCRGGWHSAGVVCLPKKDSATSRRYRKKTTPKPTTTPIPTTTTRPTTKPTTPTTTRTLWTIWGPTPLKPVKSDKTPEEMLLDDKEHISRMSKEEKPMKDFAVQSDQAVNIAPVAAEEGDVTGAVQGSNDTLSEDNQTEEDGTTYYSTTPTPETTTEALHNNGVQIRIRGGRYFWEGRLEVKRNPEETTWGTVCGKVWSIRETIVACRELGLDYGKQALQVNYFGGQNMDKVYNEVKCNGRENRLDECFRVETADSVSCAGKHLVAGIVCSKFLPDLVPSLHRLEESILLQDRPLYYLQCALEENCLSSSAMTIRNTSKNWMSASRRLLKFSTVVHNRGVADFRPYRAKGQWEWHQCHMHYHSMEVFAHYDIIDEHGNRLAEGSKASFCLEDSRCENGITPKYDCTGFGDQGLSVNCSDNYMNDIDCQWIDITDIPVGKYIFKMEVNPKLLVAELDYDNNVAVCDLTYTMYNAFLQNCRYESLL